MKNFIPLILAVVLGLAAVLAVGRLLMAQKMAGEETITVVAAVRDIQQGQELTRDMIRPKEIPISAVPAQAINWSRSEMILAQKALRPITANDYVMLTDVGFSRSLANILGDGEWAVSLPLPGEGISSMVQPGDEVAIIGHFSVQITEPSADISAPAVVVEKEATLVLFPRVRVLEIVGSQGGMDGGGGEIILALPPQQAQALIAAQRRADLSLALRKPNDESNLSRSDAGLVDELTFQQLMTGPKTVVIQPDSKVTLQ